MEWDSYGIFVINCFHCHEILRLIIYETLNHFALGIVVTNPIQEAEEDIMV